MKRLQMIIITPTGKNVGKNIINTLTDAGLYPSISIKTINTTFDPFTRNKKTVVQYSYL